MRALLLAIAVACGVAHAQPYPVKPIRVIVPVAAGGNQEITIRAVAEEMVKSLGQPLLVEARPSASASCRPSISSRSASTSCRWITAPITDG